MSEPEKLQVSYRYTYPMLKEAIGLASRRASRRGPSTRRLYRFLIAGFATLVVLILVVVRKALGLGPEAAALGVVFAAVLLMAIYGTCLVGAIASDLLKKPQYSNEIGMVLDRRGVSIESEHATCWFGWSVVDEIVELETGLGLSSGCCIYPVPDQALPSGMTRELLREQLEAWRKAAQ